MPNYRRNWVPGGTFFFTVNLLERGDNDLLIRRIDLLRDVCAKRPFEIVAWVVMPDHMHAV
jgi:putative transposase